MPSPIPQSTPSPCPAIVLLGPASLPVAHRIQAALPGSTIYSLERRTRLASSPNSPEQISAENVGNSLVLYANFGETVRELFQAGRPIFGLCAAGILIRTIAPLLNNKWQEPPVLAIAEDGSAVVPLLGGLQGANDLARRVAAALQVAPAITTAGELRFGTALLSPPPGYRLLNRDDAKSFLSDLLAGAKVKLVGHAPWLEASDLPWDAAGTLTLQIISAKGQTAGESSPACSPSQTCLVYEFDASLLAEAEENCPQLMSPGRGKLAIVGTGPGAVEWMSPEVKTALETATDWVGYKTYLDLVEFLRLPQIVRHDSDNRVELDRARTALNLAAEGRSVAVVSSGDPGIYAMAAAVFEVMERENQPAWAEIEVRVCPGISAMQAAAATVGAPLGHDFCAISLSDLLKPWQAIASRIAAAAEADFAIAFYNPVSSQRTWQLAKAQEIVLQWRSPSTPVVLARNVGRSGQQITVSSLGEFAPAEADMRTIVLVGSSKTRLVWQDGEPGEKSRRPWVYTPRFYEA